MREQGGDKSQIKAKVHVNVFFFFFNVNMEGICQKQLLGLF